MNSPSLFKGFGNALLSSNQDNDESSAETRLLNHPAIDRCEKNVCVVPHSRQRKWK